MIVRISGLDGAGKTTLSRAVAQALQERGHPAEYRKIALFDNPAFRRYREALRFAAHLNPAAERSLRSALVTLETLATALPQPSNEGGSRAVTVVYDRYLEGTRLYMRVRDLQHSPYEQLFDALPAATLDFYLKVSLDETTRRHQAMGQPLTEGQRQFLQNMERELESWAALTRPTVLDATLRVEELTAQVVSAVLSHPSPTQVALT